MTRRYVCWTEFEVKTRDLAVKIKNSGKEYKSILTFQRGGGPLASMLAHLLDITKIISETHLLRSFIEDRFRYDNFEEFIIQSYLDSDESNDIISDFTVNKYTLVVVDLKETGLTVKPYVEAGLDDAVLFFKPVKGVLPPVYYSELCSKKVWIDFPYEQVNAPMKRDRD